ncbi:2-oxo acid dehydrogenase subunit E2 [Cohnella pontilimi]|uniref:Dihydrolipoamide acetyltransferase component of pyruvate dehydrogenase complex n=1 Tax=Cohnella pontilimi TaxID=2564100 RepID=A0A4U0FHJ2_9BACL|nr:dihydrolipoamide acetyltransferase family protein [Cohnella pontilimi]TJY44421.1 2-oxo acid dehydrogenase subunit E2 [Cohnella pontilimi]
MPKQIVEIIMPQLAESLVNATIDRWLKQPGDMVDMYEPICELITDKVNAELPSTARGKLVKILAGAGELVDVGTPIALVETEGAASPAAEMPTAPAEPMPASEPVNRPAAVQASPAAAFDPDAPMRARYSPAVQKLAADNGVDLSRIAGSGMGGRITRKDVLDAVTAGNRGNAFSAAAPAAPVEAMARMPEPPRIPIVEVDEGQAAPGSREYAIDVTPIRNTIAKNMRQSVNEIPHAWTMVEVDLTNLVELRNRLKDGFKKQEGINLTFMPFLLKAVVGAIKEYPLMNSVWAVDKIIVKRDINLSLAVGTEDSVLTPVIRNADQKTITGLAHEIHELARKTREGKLKLSDMQGGTFTVNNTGTFGSVLSYPIINYPQAAILTFEAIVKRPVVIGDMLGIRSMVNLCLSFDHRILDGIICGRFHQKVKEILEGFGPDTKLY